MTIVASRKGFYPAGKRLLLSHSLVSLLQQISRVFDSVSLTDFHGQQLQLFYLVDLRSLAVLSLFSFTSYVICMFTFLLVTKVIFLQAYKALMKAFTEHNKVSIV